MTNSHDFPAEFPADPEDGAGALRWTIGVLVPTALALAMLNAEAIVNWAQELPANPRTAQAMTAADDWNARTAELGLDGPRKALHRAWKRAQAARWSERSRSG
jgi:hypothetical protein